MQVIILGAGQVGGAVAAYLVSQGHSVTVVDHDLQYLQDLEAHFDLQTVHGYASHPSVLAQANAQEADMLIAVTPNDEVNMIACQVAHSLFGVSKKIARIRSQDYFISQGVLFDKDRIPVDIFINPERLVTQGLQYLIAYPGSMRILDFADGKVKLVAARPAEDSLWIGKNVTETPPSLAKHPLRIVGVFRGKQSLPIASSTQIHPEDLLFFTAASPDVSRILSSFQPSAPAANRHILIFGGNSFGFHLASVLENDYSVKLIEPDKKRAEWLATRLKKTLILHGDGSNKDLLHNENIESVDVFCALTEDDENNIVSCLQARQMGAKQVIALIYRPAYIELIESGAIRIDVAVSAQQSAVGAILAPIRRAHLLNAYALRHGAAEAMELIVQNTGATGRSIKDLKLHPETRIGALVRKEMLLIPNEETVIQIGDHLVLFVTDKKWIPEIETLFQIKKEANH